MKTPRHAAAKRVIAVGSCLVLAVLVLGIILSRPTPEQPPAASPSDLIPEAGVPPEPFAGSPRRQRTGEAARTFAASPAPAIRSDSAAVFAAFAEWRRRLPAAAAPAPPASPEWLEQGTRLAAARRPAMLQLMRDHPRLALEQSLPWPEWAALPASLQALLEEPFSATADYEVELNEPPGDNRLASGLTRHVTLRGQRYVAHVFGRREPLRTKLAVPLQGIALGNEVVLWDSAVQPLRPEDLRAVRRLFPEGNAPNHSWWSGQLVGAAARAALCGGKIYYFASDAEVQAFADTLAAAESGLGPHTVHRALAAASTGETFAAATFEQTAAELASAWTEGPKHVLCLRYEYTPALGLWYRLAEDELLDNLLVASNAIREMSYGKTWLVPTMASELFTLAGSETDYGSDPPTTLLNQVATNAGYRLDDYDFVVYATPRANPTGRANVGGPSQRIFGRAIPAIHVHEFGHNYGLEHANFWNATSGSGFGGHASDDGPIEHSEYGDIFDIMGSDRYAWPDGSITFPNGHYSMHGKAHLNWIEADEVLEVTASGTYRVYRFDHPSARSGAHPLALKVANRDGQELWIGFRRNFTQNDSLSSGAYLVWAPSGASHRLLDTTPLSCANASPAKDREDAALAPHRAYTDPSGSVRITNLGWDGSAPYEYLDLQIVLMAGQVYEHQFGVFANATLSTSGLTGSYVNRSLQTDATQEDWRDSQTIAGTRRDAFPGFRTEGWGRLDLVGLTDHSGDDFNHFSVQWDGWLQVPLPMRFATISDDGSRLWIDLNGDGSFDASGPELIPNHWGDTQNATLGDVSPVIPPGVYPLRLQYYEAAGDDYVLLCGAPATNLYIWDGSASGHWGSGANWNTGTVPPDGAGLLFPAGAARLVTTNNTSTTRRYRSIVIAGGGYVLRGNSLSLSNGLHATYPSGSGTVELNLTLRDAQIFQCAVSGLSLNVTGELDLGGHALTVNGEGNVHLGGVLDGSGELTKNGTGTLYLEGPGLNTYEGVTRVNAGRLVLNKSAFPAIPLGELIIGDGVGGTAADQVLANRDYQIGTIPITINSSGLLDLEGYDDTVGSIEFNGGRVATGGEFTLGTLTLGGNVTVNASGRAIIEGQLQILATRTFNIANSSASPDLELRAVVSGSGGLIKNGSGALGLYAANTFAGAVTINNGLVYTYMPTALGTDAAGTTVNSGGVLVVANNNHLAAEPLTLNGSGDGISGALASTGGSNSCAGVVTLASDSVITVRTNYCLNLTGVVDGPGNLIQRQPGTLVLSGASANTFAGDAVVEEGTLEMNKSAVNGAVPGTLRIGTDSGPAHSVVARNLRSSQCDVVVVNATGLYDLNGFNETVTDLTLNYGGDVQTGSGTLTLGGSSHVSVNHNPLVYAGTVATISGRLNVGSGSRRLVVLHGLPPVWNPVDLELAAVVSGSATLIKEGSGLLGLTAPNTFTGGLTISNGTVRLTHSAALGTTGGGTTVHPGTQLSLVGGLDVAGETLTFAGASAGTLSAADGSNRWTGALTLESAATLDVAGAGDALDLSGVIGGTGHLTKSGAGTLILRGSQANTLAGRIRVNAGTLELDKNSGHDAIPGELEIGDGAGGAEADVVRWLRNYQIDSQAGVTLASSGRLEVNGQTETIGSLAGSGRVELGDGALTVGYNGRDTEFSGVISGADGRLSKYGHGTLILSGNNTYSGRTTVNYGVLLVEGYQADSPVQVNSLGTLAGSGQVGPLTNSGAIAPGPTGGTGVLTCDNAALTGDAAVLAVDLNGTEPGEGYDMLNVRGEVVLDGASLQVSLGFAPKEGDQFRIIANDNAEPVVGTFAGLPDDSLFTVNGVPLQIDYDGNTGNEIVLTVTNTALASASATVWSGNGNGVVDPDECNLLSVVLTNRSAHPVADIYAQLTTAALGVWISQEESPFPNLAPGQAGTNRVPFQFTTRAGFPCGANIELTLTVNTLDHGRFTIPLSLPSGSLGSGSRFDVDKGGAIPDEFFLDSPVDVSGITARLADVRVSCFITHPSVGDLSLLLVSPDNTVIQLSMGNGGRGDNYGTACADLERTSFDDSARDSIATEAAPFVGRFRPETPLSRLRGTLGNGTWRLRMIDTVAGNAGTLQCWSLVLYPATCTLGGGPCLLCPDHTLTGTVTASDPSYTGRLQLNGTASACNAPKPCPGSTGDHEVRHGDVFPFLNGPAPACVTVSLTTDCPLFSAVFTNRFDALDFCHHYLADPGRPGTQSYSFNLAPGAAFAVVVSELDPGSSSTCGAYTLSVTGGSCIPGLAIARTATDQVQLTWPTFAPDCLLEATSVLDNWLSPFNRPLTPPIVIDSRYSVTEPMAASNCFYRLYQP